MKDKRNNLIIRKSDYKRNKGAFIWEGKKEDYTELKETRKWRCLKCHRILANNVENDIITVKGEGRQEIKIRFKAIRCICPGSKRKGTEGCNTDNRLVSYVDLLSEKYEPIQLVKTDLKIQKEIEESRNKNIQNKIEELSNL
jgi:hypothetical protein